MSKNIIKYENNFNSININGSKGLVNINQVNPIPLQLPPRAQYFTGRTEQLKKLINDLQPNRVITICGAGGMGKSALAAEAIYLLVGEKNSPPERFPDGIVFHSFYNEPSAEVALSAIAQAYNIDLRGVSDESVQKILSNKVALLVLDGTEDADDLSRVLAVVGKCGVLITSRDKKDAKTEQQDMYPLPQVDAVKLLVKWAENNIDNLDTAERICELIGNLPLAVRLVGRYLAEAGDSAEGYLQWLQEAPFEALDPDEAKHRHQSIHILLKRSINQLNEVEKQVLAVFGNLAMSPVSLSTFIHVILSEEEAKEEKTKEKEAKRILQPLINSGLLEETKIDYYEVTHALIHTYAREQLDFSYESFQILVSWYNTLIYIEYKKGLAGYNILDTQRAHIFYLIEQAYQRQAWEEVMSLVSTIDKYLDIRGYWGKRKEFLQLGLKAAQILKDSKNESNYLINLGTTYFNLSETEKAIDYYQQALIITQKIKNQETESIVLGNLGVVYNDIGEIEKATDYYQQALTINQKVNNQKGEESQLGNLGNAYFNLGDIDKTVNYYQEAFAIAREINDQQGEGNHLGNLGNAYFTLGEIEKAIDYYQQALTIAQEIGDRKREGNHLGNLGNVYFTLGEIEKAIDYYQQALTITKEIGYQKGQEKHLGDLGNAYFTLGEIEKAIDYYQQALLIAQKIKDRQREENYLCNLSNIYSTLGEIEKAIDYYQQALAITQEIGDKQKKEGILNNIGVLYKKLAQSYFNKSLQISGGIKSNNYNVIKDNLNMLSSNTYKFIQPYHNIAPYHSYSHTKPIDDIISDKFIQPHHNIAPYHSYSNNKPIVDILSKKEEIVLRSLLDGKTMKEIGNSKEYISHRYAEKILLNLRKKFGGLTIHQLVAHIVRLDLI